MKKIILIILVLGLNGCVSSIIAYRTNNEHIRNVIQAKAVNGNPFLGVDVMGLTTAYFTAWGDHPAMMTGATAADLATGYAMYEFGRQTCKKDVPGTTTPPTIPNTINAEIVIIGDHNTVDQDQTK